MMPVLFVFPDAWPLVGGHAIYAYGVMLGLALVVGWYVTLWGARRQGMDSGGVMMVLGSAILGGVVGARVLFFVSNPGRWEGVGSLWSLGGGGLVLYGGFLGGLLACALALRVVGGDFWRVGDLAAPQLALGVAIARLGCFFYGCDFGRRVEGWPGVRFPHWDHALIPGVGASCGPGAASCPPLSVCDPSSWVCVTRGAPAWNLHRRLGDIGVDAVSSAAVHPVQLYAALNGLALFVALVVLWRWGRRFHGQVLLAFLAWYAAARYVLELFREDMQRGEVFSVQEPWWLSWAMVSVRSVGSEGQVVESYALTTSQFISLVMLCVVSVLAVVAWRREGRGGGGALLGSLGERVDAQPGVGGQ